MSSVAGPDRPVWVQSVLPALVATGFPFDERSVNRQGSARPVSVRMKWSAGSTSGTSAGTTGAVIE